MARETEKERLERNLAEELRELRVAQTGVQILFAFLLTLPFTAAFSHHPVPARHLPHIAAVRRDRHRIDPRRSRSTPPCSGRNASLELVQDAHWLFIGGLGSL